MRHARESLIGVMVGLALVAAGGCGGDDAESTASGAATTAPVDAIGSDEREDEPVPPVDDADDATVQEIVAALDAADGALLPELGNPMESYEIPIEWYDATLAALDELGTELPPAEALSGPEVRSSYDEMLAAIDSWRAEADDARSQLEAERAELESQVGEWFAALETDGEPGGPPPQAYIELIDVNFAASDRFGQACAEFANVAGVAPACFGTGGDPGAVEPGAIEIEIGDLRATVDPGPVAELYIDPDFAGFDLGPMESLGIFPPPPVRDPAAAIESSTEELDGALLAATVPWPADLDAYLDELPIAIESDGVLETPAGELRSLVLSQDVVAGLALASIPQDPQGSAQIRRNAPLYLWVGELAGQQVVAILEVGAGEHQLFVDQAEEVLASLTPVG